MPREPNRLARIIVPLVLSALGVVFTLSFLRTKHPATPPATPAAATAQPGAASAGSATAPAAQPVAPAAAPAAASGGAAAAPALAAGSELHAEVFPPGTPGAFLGSIDPASAFLMRVDFSSYGAGVRSLALARYKERLDGDARVELQAEHSILVAGSSTPTAVLTPFAALLIVVNAQAIPLAGTPEAPVWSAVGNAPGTFEAFIADKQGQRVLRVERAYSLGEGSYDLRLRQQLTNLSGSPLRVQFYQIGPVDPPKDILAYVGDRRRFRFGYLLSPAKDPSRSFVLSDDYLIDHATILGKPDKATGAFPAELAQWPNKRAQDNGFSLVWAGATNRYFGVAALPLFPDPQPQDKSWRWVGAVNRVVLGEAQKVGLRLDSQPLELAPAGAPGSTADLSLSLFAGPLDTDAINAEPVHSALGLGGLIVHNMGGPCAFCTFKPITDGLLWLLQFLHNTIVFDWALAIICLVVIVRALLHPVTKWSQIRMARFGKQMQAIGPKQKILQERYKNDPNKLREETARLWREEGISPTGMFGCIPPFLQMPIWIALYATLFFAVELRHQPAFFGVFQKIGLAHFMADMAQPDRFVDFGGKSFSIPLLSSMMGGAISSINLLPLVLAVVFFIQQKYLTPPTTAQMTPEQEMQTKMMKWMSVVMFPLFMYNTPCGLTLYFTVNSTFAILESRYIRRHIDKYEKKTPTVGKKSGAPGQKSFMERVLAAAEQRRKALEARAGARPGSPQAKKRERT